MSPSIARPGELPQDPEPGSNEWDHIRRQHDEAVSRVAKLRLLQSALPEQIRDAEFRVRVLATSLGLAVVVQKQSPNAKLADGLTVAMHETLDALPGRVGEVAKNLGISTAAAGMRLHKLDDRGLVVKPQMVGGEWRRRDKPEADAA